MFRLKIDIYSLKTIFLSLIVFFLVNLNVYPVIVSRGDGNWNNPDTWGDSPTGCSAIPTPEIDVPQPDERVRICSGHEVTANTLINRNEETIVEGTLQVISNTFNAAGLKINGNSAKLIVRGNATVLNNSGILNIGDGTLPGTILIENNATINNTGTTAIEVENVATIEVNSNGSFISEQRAIISGNINLMASLIINNFNGMFKIKEIEIGTDRSSTQGNIITIINGQGSNTSTFELSSNNISLGHISSSQSTLNIDNGQNGTFPSSLSLDMGGAYTFNFTNNNESSRVTLTNTLNVHNNAVINVKEGSLEVKDPGSIDLTDNGTINVGRTNIESDASFIYNTNSTGLLLRASSRLNVRNGCSIIVNHIGFGGGTDAPNLTMEPGSSITIDRSPQTITPPSNWLSITEDGTINIPDDIEINFTGNKNINFQNRINSMKIIQNPKLNIDMANNTSIVNFTGTETRKAKEIILTQGTLDFTGSNTPIETENLNISGGIFQKGSAALNVTKKLEISGSTLQVNPSSSLNLEEFILSGGVLQLNGLSFNVNTKFNASGGELNFGGASTSINFSGNDWSWNNNVNLMNEDLSKFIFTGTANISLPGSFTIPNIEINKTSGTITQTGALTLDSLLLNNGTYNQNGQDLTVNDFLSLEGGTFNTNGNLKLISANLTRNSGSFNAIDPSTVEINLSGADQAISSDWTFHNLTLTHRESGNRNFSFENNKTIIVNGIFTAMGTSSNRLILNAHDSTCSTPDCRWNISLQGNRSLNYLTVEDSDASASDASLFPISAGIGLDIQDNGNNLGWFPSTESPDITSATTIDANRSSNYDNGDQIFIKFTIPTNTVFGPNPDKAQIDNLLTFSDPLGSSYSALWIDAKTLVITIDDITGGSPVPGTTTVTLKTTAGLQFIYTGPDVSSPASITLDGSFIDFLDPPSITAATADDPNNRPGYSAGDIITIVFDQQTNQTPGTTLTKDEVDALFTISDPLGEDYTAEWLDSSTIRITIVDPSGGDPRIGSTTFTVKETADIRTEISSGLISLPSTDTSVLTGGFGDIQATDAPAIISIIADDPDDDNPSYSQGDTITITFDIETNQTSGTTLTKDEVDALFTTSDPLGEDYTAEWLDSSTIRITIIDPFGGSPSIGSTTFTVKETANLKDKMSLSLPSSSTSPVLEGDFGRVTNFSRARIFPVIFRARLHSNISFLGLPQNTKIEVYNTYGRKLYEINTREEEHHWDVVSLKGVRLGSGVYRVIFKSSGKVMKNFKFLVVR